MIVASMAVRTLRGMWCRALNALDRTLGTEPLLIEARLDYQQACFVEALRD